MWYVTRVRDGSEEKVVELCRKKIGIDDREGSLLRECFTPYIKQLRRYLGEWHMEQKVLFPGYVFLVSDNPEELDHWLNRMGITKLLGPGNTAVPLEEEEVAFLQRLCGEDHVVEFSVGIINEDQIIVRRGPLKGLEEYVKKIDRHKRKAWIEFKMMNRVMPAQVGLEITERRVAKKA